VVAYFVAGRYAEAAEWAAKANREQPSFLGAIRNLAASSALCGHLEQAQRALARARELDPGLRISNLKDRVGHIDRMISRGSPRACAWQGCWNDNDASRGCEGVFITLAEAPTMRRACAPVAPAVGLLHMMGRRGSRVTLKIRRGLLWRSADGKRDGARPRPCPRRGPPPDRPRCPLRTSLWSPLA
jgi:tetratricopeptide (TPR) repeat protein